MAAAPVVEALERLFSEAEAAHRRVFPGDAIDPEWPIWFASYLAPKLPALLGTTRTTSELVACLLRAEEEHRVRTPEQPWARAYAEYFHECYCASPHADRDHLALYHYDRCFFCVRVRRVIEELGLPVELRDVLADRTHRADLVAARGRATVPVLRIESPDGGDRWMPESRDIIHYLRHTYG